MYERALRVLLGMKQIVGKRKLTTGKLYDPKTDQCCFLGAWAFADPNLPDPSSSKFKDKEYEDDYNYELFNQPEVNDVGSLLIEAASEECGLSDKYTPADLFTVNDDPGKQFDGTLDERINAIIDRAIEKASS